MKAYEFYSWCSRVSRYPNSAQLAHHHYGKYSIRLFRPSSLSTFRQWSNDYCWLFFRNVSEQFDCCVAMSTRFGVEKLFPALDNSFALKCTNLSNHIGPRHARGEALSFCCQRKSTCHASPAGATSPDEEAPLY